MEKHFSGKSGGGLIGRHRRHKKSPVVATESDNEAAETSESFDDHDEPLLEHDHDQISVDIDRLADAWSTADDKSTPPEIPDTVEMFTRIIESRIKRYNSTKSTRFGKMTEEDTFFIEAVRRLSKLTNAFVDFPNTSSSLDRTSKVLQQAIAFLEEELRGLLEDSTKAPVKPKMKPMKHSSFKSDRCAVPIPEQIKEEDFPGYSEEIVVRINKIVTTMISAGYENECCQVYTMARQNAIYEQVKRIEFEKVNVEDVHKSNWDSLEADVSRWIRIVKDCSKILFPAEWKLGETVFSDHLSIFRGLFFNIIRKVTTVLLDFSAAVPTTKRSAERLFKFLDMYDSLRNLNIAVKVSDSGDTSGEHIQPSDLNLNSEISSTASRIGEAVVDIFNDLENSIRNDTAKNPVQGGAVHPLTRYVMNYVRYACEYRDTLEQILKQHAKLTDPPSSEETEKSPLSAQLLFVMDLLDGNLETKSTLYKDISLRYVFLMNNGRYILQKVKGTNEIRQVMGDNWCRRRSSEVRQYHKSYQRETWTRLLQSITQEGIQVNGKVNRQVLKERFKNFNAMFEEIHKTQSTWVVSDEQLVSELRVSISAVVIPAYRSFVGRYKQYFEGGRNMGKYIKYQPEDIEAMIEALFEGNQMSMGRKRS